jgi:hypothetical protein
MPRIADAVQHALGGLLLIIDDAHRPLGGSRNDNAHKAIATPLKLMEDHRDSACYRR